MQHRRERLKSQHLKHRLSARQTRALPPLDGLCVSSLVTGRLLPLLGHCTPGLPQRAIRLPHLPMVREANRAEDILRRSQQLM